jgi:hypothetical protein
MPRASARGWEAIAAIELPRPDFGRARSMTK